MEKNRAKYWLSYEIMQYGCKCYYEHKRFSATSDSEALKKARKIIDNRMLSLKKSNASISSAELFRRSRQVNKKIWISIWEREF